MVVYDRDFARVWYDGATPCVFSTVVAVPRKEEMHELLDRQLSLIKELRQRYGFVLSICDLQYCKRIPDEIASIYVDRLGEQFNAGLVHKSFVKPHNDLARRMLASEAGQLTRLSISLHNTFEDALTDMNNRRVKKNYSLVSSMFVFLRNL